MKLSNCRVDEAAEIDDAGGALRAVVVVCFLEELAGEASDRGIVDSAERNLLTCFL